MYVVLCLLGVPKLLCKKTSGGFTSICGKKVFRRRMIVLIRRKVVIITRKCTLSMVSNLISTLLLMSGDVELNPGPGE